LTQVANLNNESSVFTVLFPTNEAWQKSFNVIKDYYKTTPADGGWSKQKKLAQAALVKDLVFSGNYKEDGFPDSIIISSSGNIFSNPADLFQGSTSYDASNGVIYVTDSLRMPATESWHTPILIEAESSSYGRTALNAKVYNRTSYGTAIQTSGYRYLEVEATGTTILSKTYVDFPIPDVLSAKYDIYCLFVPEGIVNRINPKPNVVNIYLSHLDAAGKLKNNVSMKKGVTISASDTTLVHVTQMDFPYCNVMDMNSDNSDILVKLRVENAVTASQTRLYTRTMRIDCIIFVRSKTKPIKHECIMKRNISYISRIVLSLGLLWVAVTLGSVNAADNTADNRLFVKGQVLSQATRQPLFGASVRAGKSAVFTNEEGRFELVIQSANEVLLVTEENYVAREYPLRGRQDVVIELYPKVFGENYKSIELPGG
jgi:hypothetical protein